MITGETPKGFRYEIEEEKLDNMELVDAMVESEENPNNISTVCKLLLGTEQRKRLYNHLRTEKGNVPIADVLSEVNFILNEEHPDVKK